MYEMYINSKLKEYCKNYIYQKQLKKTLKNKNSSRYGIYISDANEIHIGRPL